jgi:hypothetical protein
LTDDPAGQPTEPDDTGLGTSGETSGTPGGHAAAQSPSDASQAGRPDASHEGAPDAAPAGAHGEPSEEELRAAYEAELSRITSADMMLQAAVSLLNIGARRLGLVGGAPDTGRPPESERDLEQVRDAIDGVKALVGILERRVPQELGPLRDALSRLQIAYAREAQAGAAGEPAPPAGEGGQGGEGEKSPGAEDKPGGPGPAQSSGRLWVPGS